MVETMMIKPKLVTVKFIIDLYGIKPKDIQMQANLSKSFVSRYLNGQRPSVDIDLFLVEKVFGIKKEDIISSDRFNK